MPDKQPRKPLDAEYVNRGHKAAMRAIADLEARRKWPDSKYGSPVSVMVLCAEVARLNIAQGPLLDMARLLAQVCEYEIRKARADDDEEGARLKTITLNLANEAIAKATQPSNAEAA